MTTTNASSTGTSSSGRTGWFARTRWSIVLATRDAEPSRAATALKGALTVDLTTGSYADVAKSLSMTEGTIKVAVHRLRKRYREVLKAEIAQTVADPQQVSEELKALFAAF